MAHGAKRQAYPVIAASGPNASTLHYADNDQPLRGRQLVVLDAGAEWRCYASDVTRTFPVAGRFSAEAAAVYAVVERVQRECIERVRPGVPFYMLHLHACVVAVTGLLELGVLRGATVAEILEAGTVAAFFPHGLGHHVGLEVHDVSGRERLLLGGILGARTTGQDGERGKRVSSKREMIGPAQVCAMYRESLFDASQGVVTKEASAAASGGGTQKLEKNMVVTIEPGM
jgi:Xaa-Pro dipeptidase